MKTKHTLKEVEQLGLKILGMPVYERMNILTEMAEYASTQDHTLREDFYPYKTPKYFRAVISYVFQNGSLS